MRRRGRPRTETGCLLVRSRAQPERFADFYDAYADRVLRFLAARVLDAEIALDLLSETFAVALERRDQFRGDTPEEEAAWLFAIARTTLNGFWRRGRIERDALRRIGVEVPAMTDRELERLEDRAGVQAVVRQLGDALGILSADQRRAVELRVVDDRSYADIAADEGITQQVARARVSRGLRTLAGHLNEQGVLAEDLV